MSRVLLLCFLHGFKGTENTFKSFPEDLQATVAEGLPEHHVESIIYPKYETKGELSQATESFLAWLKDRAIETRKAHLSEPWPPNDDRLGIVIVAHSMGGFVASDALLLALSERASATAGSPSTDPPLASPTQLFPPIRGILLFDTPLDGLARSMFVYGAFSNYQKVSSVFNTLTALSVAVPSGVGRLLARGGAKGTAARAGTAAAAAAGGADAAAKWKAWQLLATRTGTVGAIAAGGAAAWIHREAIVKGFRDLGKTFSSRESIVDGYRQGASSIGQGLAYVNRGNVGRAFAWLGDHFTFVGALMKPNELARRLERLGNLKGVGVLDLYSSLGENGVWTGGYFVPERTFCAVPEKDHPASPFFERWVVEEGEDEVKSHVSMFVPSVNKGYEQMTGRAAGLVKEWFLNVSAVVEEESPARELSPEAEAEDQVVKEALSPKSSESVEDGEASPQPAIDVPGVEPGTEVDLPDESPIDIVAAASLVPLPGGDEKEILDGASLPSDPNSASAVSEEKRTYMQHLFRIAQQTGTTLQQTSTTLGSSIKDMVPSKAPSLPSKLPSLPQVSMPNVSMPTVNIFSKKEPAVSKKEPAPGDETKA